MNPRPRLVDPEPFTTALTIVGTTTAVVGMIDVIRRALRQSRMDREEAVKQFLAEEEEKRERSLRIQKSNLQRLDAHLESAQASLVAMQDLISEEGERIGESPSYLLNDRAFERFRVHSLKLVDELAPIMECIYRIEPELDPRFLVADGRIDDELDFGERESCKT